MITIRITRGIAAFALVLFSLSAAGDYQVRVKNNSPIYVDVALHTKAFGQTKFDVCDFMQIRTGQSDITTCKSTANNWRRKFLVTTQDVNNTPEWDCILNLNDYNCVNALHRINQIRWVSGKTIQSPSNGGWHGKWVVRNNGLYDITIPRNYCGNMFRPNNDLFASGIGRVTTAEERAKIKETVACMGLNDSGFSDRSPESDRSPVLKPKDMRRVNPNIPRPG
jgi:hypothetical protein